MKLGHGPYFFSTVVSGHNLVALADVVIAEIRYHHRIKNEPEFAGN